MFFNENTYEQAIIELFQGMGYTHIYVRWNKNKNKQFGL